MSPNITTLPSAQPPADATSTAAQVLENMMTSDPLLREMEMTKEDPTREGSRRYAAAILSRNTNTSGSYSEALTDVSSKLHVINGAIDELIHGQSQELAESFVQQYATTGVNASLSERCNRLRRQGDLVGSISQRVESSLVHRGLEPLEKCTRKLGRLLELNRVLKSCMKLKFEMAKVRQSNHLWKDINVSGDASSSLMMVDLRDLVRVSSSVASVEELLKELSQVDAPNVSGNDLGISQQKSRLSIVSRLESEAQIASRGIRLAAEDLLGRTLNQKESTSEADYFNILGTTFQVYLNLGELGEACWTSTEAALAKAEKASSQLLNPGNMKRLRESAQVGVSKVITKSKEMLLNEKRAEAVAKWAGTLLDAASQALKVQLVLARKIDPVSRQRFIEVVSASKPTEKFMEAATKLQSASATSFSLYDYFWTQYAFILGARIQRLLKYENGSLSEDVAALYPMMRSAALALLRPLSDISQSASVVYTDDSHDSVNGNNKLNRGIFGGSDFKADMNLDWNTSASLIIDLESSLMQSTHMWTNGRPEIDVSTKRAPNQVGMKFFVLKKEWNILQGENATGFAPLRDAFQESSNNRLCMQSSNLFVDNVAVDDNGVTMVSPLPILPSSGDLESMEKVILNEFNLVDSNSRDDFDMVEMIGNNVVNMVKQFCCEARGACSIAANSLDTETISLEHYLRPDGSMKDNLIHDFKFVDVMVYLYRFLLGLPSSLCPSHFSYYEEFCKCCERAIAPALKEIYSVIESCVLNLLGTTLNMKVVQCLSKMHSGAYVEKCDTESFVQEHVSVLFEEISAEFISRLPREFAPVLAVTIAKFCTYTFTSNLALIRPLGEKGKLRVTQDLADLELSLEQFISNSGSRETLSQIDNRKPYRELRAVRQMLFWNGFDDKNADANEIYEGIIAEIWFEDVRPSTVTNFLFSFGPVLLSSPHEFKSVKVQDYLLQNLVSLDGRITEEGELKNWTTIMGCCEAFQQRLSVISNGNETVDKRVIEVLHLVGQKLMKHAIS